MSKIRCFISYKWKDTQADFALLLAKRLRRYKDIYTWIDKEQIKIGGKLYHWLEQGLKEESDIFIPILTPEYLSSDNCLMELKYAIKLSRESEKPILPIVLMNCQIPMILEDTVWGDFRNIYTDSDNLDKAKFNSEVDNLVDSIRYFKKRTRRLQMISSSGVRNVRDLWFYLFNSAGEYGRWTNTKDIFTLYCDIALDREFSINPEHQFKQDLKDLIEHATYIEGSRDNINIKYLSYNLMNVPSKIKCTDAGRNFKEEAEILRCKAGL